MVVTIMRLPTEENLSWLLSKLQGDFPSLNFCEGQLFQWSPKAREITYNTSLSNASALLLHEVGHATLRHDNFVYDIDLLRKETAAWDFAKHYAVTIAI